MTEKEFWNSIIAQDDDCDWEESGWVIVKKDNWCGMARYNHCSCYGTWDSIKPDNINGITWDWQGSYEELLNMAKKNLDPCIPGRLISTDDYDADHLLECYKQVLSKVE